MDSLRNDMSSINQFLKEQGTNPEIE